MDSSAYGRAFDDGLKMMIGVALLGFAICALAGFGFGYQIGERNGEAKVRQEAFVAATTCETLNAMGLDDWTKEFAFSINCQPMYDLSRPKGKR